MDDPKHDPSAGSTKKNRILAFILIILFTLVFKLRTMQNAHPGANSDAGGQTHAYQPIRSK